MKDKNIELSSVAERSTIEYQSVRPSLFNIRLFNNRQLIFAEAVRECIYMVGTILYIEKYILL